MLGAKMKELTILFLLTFCMLKGIAQENPDRVYDASIHTVMVSPVGKPLEVPIVNLSGSNPLMVSFDDFKMQYQDYYYSIELVDSMWKSVEMSEFDYARGFNQNKINSFSVSSIASQKYFHYQFTFPNSNCSPKLSGNYILKVYKDGNKEALVFSKRFYVVEPIANVAVTVNEPFDGAISKTHQLLKVSVDIKNIPNFQNDKLAVRVVQNYRYQDTRVVTTPSFIRNSVLEFNNEMGLLFPAGNEYRWLDLQSLSLRSDRIAEINNISLTPYITLKPDQSRTDLLYNAFNDLNGLFLILNTESLQSENQNDYAQVLFTYIPKDNIPFAYQKLYLAGALTNNVLDANAEMHFDAKLGVYQKLLLLKQGYYSYSYIIRDKIDPNIMDDFAETEGNHTEAENNYGVFVYYRAPGSRYDQLVGYTSVNSKQN
jgi:hypothetical protein